MASDSYEYYRSRKIRWGKGKIFVVFCLFVASIALISLAALPFINMVPETTDYLNVLIGVLHFLKFIEFTYLAGPMELFVWCTEMAVLDVVTVLVSKYQDVFI